MSNTPGPDLDDPAYECVADHSEDYATECTWPYETSTASLALRQALDELPEDEGDYIDMDPWVCPGGTCVSVYRNVLTYRQGSHITATFTEVLSAPLADQLVPVINEAASVTPEP